MGTHRPVLISAHLWLVCALRWVSHFAEFQNCQNEPLRVFKLQQAVPEINLIKFCVK